jgi:arylsulfatase A-like enzyme
MLLSCAVGASVVALACDAGPKPRLEVAQRILDPGPDPDPGGAVGPCELDAETRSAIGCVTTFYGSVADVDVPASPAVLRRRLEVPTEARGGPILVESKLYFAGDDKPKFLPGVAVVAPAGETIDVDLPILPGIPSGRARLDYRLRPIPPAMREHSGEEIAVPPGAVLDLGVALDPLAQWVGVSPVEMELLARRPVGDVRLFRTLLRPGGADVGSWQDHRVGLAPVAGEVVRFVLRSRAVAPPGGESEPAWGFPLWGTANVLVPGPAGRAPNIVLVSLDTLRADLLGVYGSALPTSPEIDRFAGEATVFEHAYATWSSTLHSHMSLFTGRYPSAFGDVQIGRRLSPRIPTLPELLARGGYRTAAVTEDALLRGPLGFRRGVDEYRENRSASVDRAPGQAEKTFGDGLRWLARHRDERFFLFLHTYQVHDPYTPPKDYDRFRSWRDESGIERSIDDDTPGEVRQRSLYAGEVLYLDSEVRRLLDGLAALDLADDTIVLLIADHGEEFREHGLMGHGKALFEESVHVPLLMRAPGIAPGGLRVPALVSLVDVLPTLLEVASVDPPPGLQGRSLIPLLSDPSAPGLADRVVYSELHTEFFEQVAVRDRANSWIFSGLPTPRVFAFDRGRDPYEQVRLHDPDLLARGAALRGELEASTAEARSALSADPSRLEAEPLDDATAAKLRALGYAD